MKIDRAVFPGRALQPLALALLVTLVMAGMAGCGETTAVATAPAPLPVLVVQPIAAGSGATAFAGDVRARVESPLSFRTGGNLIERRVDVGDHVRRGDLLAVLDGRDAQAQSRAAQAQLSAAQAELGRARADQARYAQLGAEQLVSRSTLDATTPLPPLPRRKSTLRGPTAISPATRPPTPSCARRRRA